MRTSRVHTWSVAMPIFIYFAVVSSLLIVVCCGRNAGERFAGRGDQRTRGSAKALAFRFDTNPRRHPGTRARHDVTTCARCRPEDTVGA